MFYIIGTKKQREEFENTHWMPYFEYAEYDRYGDYEVACYSNDDEDDFAILVVKFEGDNTPVFMVQRYDEKTGLTTEGIELYCYESALKIYEEVESEEKWVELLKESEQFCEELGILELAKFF